MCTCCFMSNRQIVLPQTKGGEIRGALAAPNQTVSRDTWLGVDPSEVEALLRLAELQASPEGARSAAHTVNTLS